MIINPRENTIELNLYVKDKPESINIKLKPIELNYSGDYVFVTFLDNKKKLQIEVLPINNSGYPFPVSNTCDLSDFIWEGSFSHVELDEDNVYFVFIGIFNEWESGNIYVCPRIINRYNTIKYPLYIDYFIAGVLYIKELQEHGINVKSQIKDRKLKIVAKDVVESFYILGGWIV